MFFFTEKTFTGKTFEIFTQNRIRINLQGLKTVLIKSFREMSKLNGLLSIHCSDASEPVQSPLQEKVRRRKVDFSTKSFMQCLTYS